MSDPVSTFRSVVKLRKPIQFGTETISELNFREPKAKDFRGMPLQPSMGDLLDLAGRLTAQSKPVIDELGPADMLEVLERVSDFFPAGPGTGPKP